MLTLTMIAGHFNIAGSQPDMFARPRMGFYPRWLGWVGTMGALNEKEYFQNEE